MRVCVVFARVGGTEVWQCLNTHIIIQPHRHRHRHITNTTHTHTHTHTHRCANNTAHTHMPTHTTDRDTDARMRILDTYGNSLGRQLCFFLCSAGDVCAVLCCAVLCCAVLLLLLCPLCCVLSPSVLFVLLVTVFTSHTSIVFCAVLCWMCAVLLLLLCVWLCCGVYMYSDGSHLITRTGRRRRRRRTGTRTR